MPDNWWESEPLVSPASDPGFTGFIPGSPKPKEPKEPPSGFARNADGSLTPIKGGPADPFRPGGELDPSKPGKDPKAQESERTAAYLASNLTANVNILSQAIKADPSAAAPTVGQEVAGLFGQASRNFATPAQRQVAYNAQRLITDAALTLGTGAAYTKEQIDAYTRGFFPQVGDSPEAIESKRKSLRAALIAARIKAGGNADKIDEAMLALGLDPTGGLDKVDAERKDAAAAHPPANGKPPAPPPTGGGGVPGGPDSIGAGELTKDQERAYRDFWARNPNPTPEQLTSFFSTVGVGNVSNAAEIIAAKKKSGQFNTATIKTDHRNKVQQRLRALDDKGLDANPLETIAVQGATAGLSDEAAGVGNALGGLLGGNFNVVENYALGRDVEKLRIQNAREQLGYGATVVEFASGLAMGRPTAALGALTGAQAARAAGTGGAVGGAIGGFGYGEGAQGSATGAGVGALAGFALGRGGAALGNRLATGSIRQSPRLSPELAEASDATGVDLVRPMVDAAVRGQFGALESNPIAQPIIRAGTRRVANQIEAGVEGLAGEGGEVLDNAALGRRTQAAARQILEQTRNVKNTHYLRAQSIYPDRFTPEAAVASIDQDIAELGANPNGNAELISFLQGQRDDLARGGGKTIEELRQIRRNLRGQISQKNLTMTDAERRVSNALRAANTDIAEASPRAAASYLRADTYYRARATIVDDLKNSILGSPDKPLDPQEAAKNVRALMKDTSKGRRFARIMGNMDREERQGVAASIASTLGREGGAADNAFSPAKFLSDTNGMSRSALRTVFGPEGADAVMHFRTLSRALRDSTKDVNYSRSGSSILAAARGFFGSMLGLGGAGVGALANGATGAGVGALVGGTAAGVGVGRKIISARTMVDPRFARWAADAVNVRTPAAAQRAVSRLGSIIRRDPALASELQPMYDFLNQRVSAPLAANPQGEGQQNE